MWAYVPGKTVKSLHCDYIDWTILQEYCNDFFIFTIERYDPYIDYIVNVIRHIH